MVRICTMMHRAFGRSDPLVYAMFYIMTVRMHGR
jgi:hypothetical protein